MRGVNRVSRTLRQKEDYSRSRSPFEAVLPARDGISDKFPLGEDISRHQVGHRITVGWDCLDALCSQRVTSFNCPSLEIDEVAYPSVVIERDLEKGSLALGDTQNKKTYMSSYKLMVNKPY